MTTQIDNHPQIRLALFFTRGVSLRSWANWGILDRETSIYRRLQKHGVRISFVTYGDQRDLQYADDLTGIDILCNRWRLPLKLYEWLLPLLHSETFRRSDVLKTNQTNGAEIALRVSRIWRKPLISRSGYMWSFATANRYGANSANTRRVERIEEKVFEAARQIIVTAQFMATDISRRIPSTSRKTAVIPNYVDVELFAPPQAGAERDVDVIFVGRLQPQKNIPSFLEAVGALDAKTIVIGGGSADEEAEFQEQIEGFNGQIQWLASRIPNSELPKQLNRAKVYVLPSHWEGHPKTLIEAMACGVPVVGTDSPGIREVIQHGKTGLLCNPSAEGIRAAIQELLGDAALRVRLGRNARRFAVKHYALDRIVNIELSIIKKVAA